MFSDKRPDILDILTRRGTALHSTNIASEVEYVTRENIIFLLKPAQSIFKRGLYEFVESGEKPKKKKKKKMEERAIDLYAVGFELGLGMGIA